MRVLIVGYGSIGKRHELICKMADPQCEIVLVTRNRFIRAKHASYVTDDIDKGIALRPDLAIVASPSSFHVQHALRLIRSGCDCLIEKPLSNNVKEALELVSITKELGRVVQIGYNLRYDRCLLHAKKIIDKQLYGDLLSVRCEFGQYLPEWRPGKDYRTSVSAKSALGGGILLEMSHEIDYLSWIVGKTNWISAWVERIGRLEIDVEDTALLRLGMRHREREVVANVSIDFIRRDRIRRCDFICEHGTIRWDGVKSILTLESNNSQVLASGSNDRNQAYLDQYYDFIECIKKKGECSNDVVSGLRTLQIIENARLSSANSGIKCYL